MRALKWAVVVGLLAGCASEAPPRLPPADRLYFPGAIVHLDGAPGSPGFLYVASTNFDRRYDFGQLTAIDLSQVGGGAGLPALGAAVGGAVKLEDLAVGPQGRVLISPFAGKMAAYVGTCDAAAGPCPARLFVPTRAERDLLYVLDAQGATVTCGQGVDCADEAISLTGDILAPPEALPGHPRAPQPGAAAVSEDGQLFVSHLEAADSPKGTRKNRESYVYTAPVDALALSAEHFIPVGQQPSSSVAVGRRYAYLTGRFQSEVPPGLRLVDRQVENRVISTRLSDEFRLLDTRDLALGAGEERVYVVGRNPDVLLVVSIEGAGTLEPRVRVVRSVPMCAQPNQVVAIPRGVGQGEVVLVTCAGSDALAVYDDSVGQLVAIVDGVGQQPYGLAVDVQGIGARVFVTNFADGRVAVVDLPDLRRPQAARVVAHLGPDQLCLTAEDQSAQCPQEASP